MEVMKPVEISASITEMEVKNRTPILEMDGLDLVPTSVFITCTNARLDAITADDAFHGTMPIVTQLQKTSSNTAFGLWKYPTAKEVTKDCRTWVVFKFLLISSDHTEST